MIWDFILVAPSSPLTYPTVKILPRPFASWRDHDDLARDRPLRWQIFAIAAFLVCGPVFVEAPLVRSFPCLSLAIAPALTVVGLVLMCQPRSRLWGDLMVGFSWSWLAGSIYWGWLRWEPLWHLPVEAIAVPIVAVCLWHGWGRVGSLFYLGSLLGTAVTDGYFYIAHLIPHWQQVMAASDPTQVATILQAALAQVHTPWGLGWAAGLATILLLAGVIALQSRRLSWWAFAGAVLSTIVVDGLFWLAAAIA